MSHTETDVFRHWTADTLNVQPLNSDSVVTVGSCGVYYRQFCVYLQRRVSKFAQVVFDNDNWL